MAALISIGDFSRATQLSIKTLRKYHTNQLLEPAWIDPSSGYRFYSVEQISSAQLIRRFRALEMPLADIRSVLSTPDSRVRNELVTAHLGRLEESLATTQRAVASLRCLLGPSTTGHEIEHRSIPASRAACIGEEVEMKEALAWFRGALGELTATFKARNLPLSGPAGGIFSSSLFAQGRGEATIFFPSDSEVLPTGRVRNRLIDAADVAVIRHLGSHEDVDLAYGALATYVAEHALEVAQPIREYYVIGPQHTDEEDKWLTELAWPIFQVRSDHAPR